MIRKAWISILVKSLVENLICVGQCSGASKISKIRSLLQRGVYFDGRYRIPFTKNNLQSQTADFKYQMSGPSTHHPQALEEGLTMKSFMGGPL